MVYILELPHWRLRICEHLTLSASAKSLKPKKQSERGEDSNLEDQWQNKEEKIEKKTKKKVQQLCGRVQYSEGSWNVRIQEFQVRTSNCCLKVLMSKF